MSGLGPKTIAKIGQRMAFGHREFVTKLTRTTTMPLPHLGRRLAGCRGFTAI